MANKKQKKAEPAIEPEVMTAEEVAAEEAAKAAAEAEAPAAETAAAADTAEAEVEAEAESAAEELPTAEEMVQKLAAELTAANTAKEAAENQLLRMQADFDNFRKRTRTEKEQWRNQLIGEICSELLPVLDNFHWATAAIRQTDAESPHLPGIQMIENQLLAVLEGKGVKKIETAGAEFDPQLHEAIAQVAEAEAEGIAPGQIFDEVQAGYLIGEKVLRPAKVRIVAKA